MSIVLKIISLFILSIETFALAPYHSPNYHTKMIESQNTSTEINWIESIHKRGFILDEHEIIRLELDLESTNIDIQQKASITIINEVILQNNKGINIRLKALKILKKYLRKDPYSTIKTQIDLHNHTNLSDAYITPTALVAEAFVKGLKYIAITDHERLIEKEAIQAAKILGINLIGGVEASCIYDEKELHMIIIYNPANNNNIQFSNEVLTILKKLKNMDEDSLQRSELIRKNMVTYLGKNFTISHKESMASSRGKLVPMTPCNALWNKHPHLIRSLIPNATSGKDFLVNFIKNHPEPIYAPTDKTNTLTIFEVAKLALELDGKIILAHPNELDKNHKKAIEIMKNILNDLRSIQINGKHIKGLVAGVETYSHKAKLSGIQKGIISEITNLNNSTFQDNPLLLLPGSDYHGNYSLPDHPLGNENNYPEDDSEIIAMIKSILGENITKYSSNKNVSNIAA